LNITQRIPSRKAAPAGTVSPIACYTRTDIQEFAVSEFEQTMPIRAESGAILDFVSDPKNLPKYLPTMGKAEPQGEGRVLVEGQAHDHPYSADGYLRCDRTAGRMEWGADEGDYAGWMKVAPNGDGESVVTVHLSFKDGQSTAGKPDDVDIYEGIMKALTSIRNFMELAGGRTESEEASS
jgi:hypothetical protein